ncbi:NADPH-dependent FMN reductase [uncultured Jatrophihabitans sp.]|uniref:NADPH-dependent FMN reductase n=1 Tax=uncultured Jatrophihabitans sp. TaxID=1610747 RepID=UPI0035CB3161
MGTVVVVGNPKPKSRTLDAAVAVVEQVTGSPPDTVIDLADLGAGLLDWADASVAEAVAQVRDARFVVVASPTYKASYTGLLKLFLDRFSAGALAGVTVVPLMLGGGLQHALAPEAFLRPVLSEIGASMPTRALYLLDSDAEAGFAQSPTLAEWLQTARPQLAGRV